MTLRRGSFPAMSTTVTIAGTDVGEGEIRRAVATGEALAAGWEARFSRFRPDSTLSRLNAAGGAAVAVDAIFLDLLDTMRAAAIRTGGRFDPSILPALEAAGYTETIDVVRAAPRAVAPPRPAAGVPAWRAVAIDRERLTVALPPGMRIDAGGIAKGAFVDALAARLEGWPGGYVDAGGDLRFWGNAPNGEHWTVGIEDPRRPDVDLTALRIDTAGLAGVATSAANRRRWVAGGATHHHLIDPATGESLVDAIASVTALAPSVTQAEVATKAILVALSRGEPPDLAESTLAATVDHEGRLRFLTRSAP